MAWTVLHSAFDARKEVPATGRAHALLPLLTPVSPSPGEGTAHYSHIQKQIPEVCFWIFVLQATEDVEASGVLLSR